MNLELERILRNKQVYQDLYDKLTIDQTKIQWPYLYFLPDITETDVVTVQPVIVAQHSATFRLGQFLNELFESLLDRQSLTLNI